MVRVLGGGHSLVVGRNFTDIPAFFHRIGDFGIVDPAAEKLVREPGYANVAMGIGGVLSLMLPEWIALAGLTGGLFLGLAGIKHAMNSRRNAKENVAMTTDLCVAMRHRALSGLVSHSVNQIS
jgi:hypothetical protein